MLSILLSLLLSQHQLYNITIKNVKELFLTEKAMVINAWLSEQFFIAIPIYRSTIDHSLNGVTSDGELLYKMYKLYRKYIQINYKIAKWASLSKSQLQLSCGLCSVAVVVVVVVVVSCDPVCVHVRTCVYVHDILSER